MANKEILLKAKTKKDDEYLTLYEDISSEVSRFKSQLRNKNILCPCDWDESYDGELVFKEEGYVGPSTLFDKGGTIKSIDLKRSKKKIEKKLQHIKCNFIKFLVSHADDYKIKSISVSGYNPKNKRGVKFQDIDYSKYDLVITNPPFSQFRDFIEILIKNNMKFLVIGPLTALGNKITFNYVKENKMWLGYSSQLSGFKLPNGKRIMSKDKEGSIPRACKWYTNLEVSYRNDKMILTEKYSSKKYPKYFNYDGIEVSKTKEIPADYKGVIGVPISFISKFNPKQFEIIGKSFQTEKKIRWQGDKAAFWIESKTHKKRKEFKINGKKYNLYAPFERILIKHKKLNK
jgi:hypothetical protein